jgi:hypothetical protein
MVRICNCTDENCTHLKTQTPDGWLHVKSLEEFYKNLDTLDERKVA